ncbi:helix-turn-helix transcriptional regulator, partial [Bacteroidota bacterium]
FKLQNEKLEIDLQMQKVEIENKSKELASIAMQITYKNEILDQIKNRLNKVSQKMIHEESKKQVLSLIKTIEKDMLHEEDWDKFEYHFDQVHEDFVKKLRNSYPELTPKDLKLCAYLRMNLSTKEIAPLLNISVRGVEVHRYRLRKKMDLDRNSNLTDYLLSI